jgi:hypothetical protein
MDPVKVLQMVNVLNGLSARDALCLLVGCMLTVLDEAPSDEERPQSLDSCIERFDALRTACDPRETSLHSANADCARIGPKANIGAYSVTLPDWAKDLPLSVRHLVRRWRLPGTEMWNIPI